MKLSDTIAMWFAEFEAWLYRKNPRAYWRAKYRAERIRRSPSTDEGDR